MLFCSIPEKVLLVLTLGGVVLTLSDRGGVGELIGIKLQIACTGRCCTISSRKKNTNVLQRRNTSELNAQILRFSTLICNHCTHSTISKRACSMEEHKYLVQNTNSLHHNTAHNMTLADVQEHYIVWLLVGWFSVPTLGL